LEIIINIGKKRPKLKAVLFDFDGTISTLRNGWEEIMEPLMLEMISGKHVPDKNLVNEVREYIDQSTGIQTYYQMEWLSSTVKKYGLNPGASEDPWWYKAEYNKRLMKLVVERIEKLNNKTLNKKDFMIAGSEEFLVELKKRGIQLFIASGTDDPDVKNEVNVLGLGEYFKEISGAPLGMAHCSKEFVLKKLADDNNLKGMEVAVFGDGKVEIQLGREKGAITIGVASDESKKTLINQVKHKKLVNAGAHAVIGDFSEKDEILKWLSI
jgi:phosphoglycolate phosphatase-like HAD superfamily hydrolase